MKIIDFIKMNKRIILVFFIIEIILFLFQFMSIKAIELKVRENPSSSDSKVDINTHEALELVKNKYNEMMQKTDKNNNYGYIQQIRYTHEYENEKYNKNRSFYAMVETSGGDALLYRVTADMECTNIDRTLYEEMSLQGGNRYVTFFDIYYDYLNNVSGWKIEKIN